MMCTIVLPSMNKEIKIILNAEEKIIVKLEVWIRVESDSITVACIYIKKFIKYLKLLL